jgi:hypothetical protein
MIDALMMAIWRRGEPDAAGADIFDSVERFRNSIRGRSTIG